MSLLLSAHQLEKSMGSRQLFSSLSFGIHEKQRIALLGPNGAGKSTLLKMLCGVLETDSGDVSPRRNLKLAYVSQQDIYDNEKTVLEVATEELISFGFTLNEAQVQASIHLSMVGFENLEQKIKPLSGGWRKRLSLAIAFAKDPDLLLLDEPTNHLDWDGILWLEGQLKTYEKAFMVVSHDREFLKNQCQQFMEINALYKDGFLSLQCPYEEFLQRKEEYVQAQKNLQDSMSNKARRETEWLRAGVKARTTKSQSRIKEAHQLLDNLDDVKQRNFAAKAQVNIEIDSAGKRSKKFIEAKELNIAYGDKKILNQLNLLLGPGKRLGLLGDNASGKTSLLKVLSKRADNYSGSLFLAEGLKIIYFDQKREDLDKSETLLSYLGDGSDHVQFKGRSLHVAAYASQFLFDQQKMRLPIERLSGGEQARLLVAKLLLQPADILILDEPTNDLDIGTIEILEQSLMNFPGLVIVVSHDRYFLGHLCDQYLALDGKGGWTFFASIEQWLKNRSKESLTLVKKERETKPKKNKKVKLSYKEKKQMETIEEDIARLEKARDDAQKALDDNTDFSDHNKTQQLVKALEEKQNQVDELYLFWQHIEEKTQANE